MKTFYFLVGATTFFLFTYLFDFFFFWIGEFTLLKNKKKRSQIYLVFKKKPYYFFFFFDYVFEIESRPTTILFPTYIYPHIGHFFPSLTRPPQALTRHSALTITTTKNMILFGCLLGFASFCILLSRWLPRPVAPKKRRGL